MVMSTILSAPMPAQDAARAARNRGLGETLKRWWAAYLRWRIEEAAVAHLASMSDRELSDIGLTRAEIPFAVRGETRDWVMRHG
jgi:uncharacterized protein YjiS (DUF1127 family)